MPPDPAMLVLFFVFGIITVMFTVLVAVVVENWASRIIVVLAGAAVFAGLWFVTVEEGYKKPKRHWEAVTNVIDGRKVEGVKLTYQRGDIDGTQVENVEDILEDAVVPPLVSVSTTDRYVDGCELEVPVSGIPAHTAAELEDDLVTVFGCATTVLSIK